MSHRVESHLEVDPESYGTEIRRFVPGYEAMQEEVVAALREQLPPGPRRVLDIGAGTGTLSARIAFDLPHVQLTLLDADPAMLAEAERRLAPVRARIELRRGSFAEPLPACDAAVACLSLHHVHDPAEKTDVYRNILRALAPGGLLVNADATVPATKSLRESLMRRWARHLVDHGDTEEQAYARFAQWSTEDRYFSIEEELAMMRAAGFVELDVRWRSGPSTVLLASRT